MKVVIDGSGLVLGRLASHVAKMALKGDEIAVVNCEKVIITGNNKDIEEKFLEKRGRVGSAQKGPKHSRLSDRIVKRSIRGMLPNHRTGRGREAFERIMCYIGTPKELESAKKMELKFGPKRKFIKVEEIYGK